MSGLTLDRAQAILGAALEEAGRRGLKPLAVVILDERGSLKAAAAQDGTSLARDKVAHGKAYGALALVLGSRALFTRAQEQPYFIAAVNGVLERALVPVPGGVPLRNGKGRLLGDIGISGDTSDNDEAAATNRGDGTAAASGRSGARRTPEHPEI